MAVGEDGRVTVYTGKVEGVYRSTLATAARRYRAAHGLPAAGTIGARVWVSLLSRGTTPVLKVGSASDAVRRVQRSLNAADRAGLAVTGVFDAPTTAAVRTYQRDHALPQTGVVTTTLWSKLQAGLR